MAADSDDYNGGRLEGHADVAARLREVLGPKHKKDNLDALIACVGRLAAVEKQLDGVCVLLDELNAAGGEASKSAWAIADAIGITLAKASPEMPVQITPGLPFLIRVDQRVLRVHVARWEMHRDVAPRYLMDAWPTYAVGETTLSLDLVVDRSFKEAKERT